MTETSTASAKKVQLLAKPNGTSKTPSSYETTAGAGDAGMPLRIKAQSATRYELVDFQTERAPQRVRAKRSGRDLEIFLEGSDNADIVIEQYYDEGIVEFPKDSLTGLTDKGALSTYVIDEGLQPALTTLEGHVTPLVLLEHAAWLNPGWGFAGVAAVAMLPSDTAAPAPAAPTANLAASSDTGVSQTDHLTSDDTPTLVGTGKAGDTITIKNAAGQTLATALVAADGTWSATTTALPDGAQTLSITETDPAGKTSVATDLSITIVGDLTITGSVTAGPVSAGVSLVAFDNTGAVLGTADIQSDGTFTIVSLGRGDYRGTVLLKATDSNGNAVNYLDEVTAAPKTMGSTLRAMGVAEVGQDQFTVNALDAALVLHITPVTELAVLKAGITSDVAPSTATTVLHANQTVAQLLGLGGVNITAQPIATNSASFNAVDGLSANEKYGILLTKLSGLDGLNGGSIAISLTQLAQSIDISSNGSITAEGAAMLDQGRQQALNALKAAPSNAEHTFLNDSTLNRQLLGDVIVTAQTVDANSKLVVTGLALPGSTVHVTLPDGTTQTAVADSVGVFTLTSAGVQPTLETPLHFVGSDALSQPAAYTAPAAPQIDIGNGQVITGVGTPGSTITLTDSAGHAIGTAVVDALGQWRVVPATPVAGTASLRASAVDAQGNVSSTGAAAVDVNQVSLLMPEAADGYINAADKASGGINLNIGLPANAQVGDSVSTVVTLPNGSTLTLTQVLTAADISARAITSTLTPAQLATDGLYNAAISLVTQVGESAPVRQSFIVDATPPAAPNVSRSNGQIINGTAEVGTLVTVKDGNGNVIGTVGPVGADGNWTLLPTQPLPNATVLNATATDAAGNTSPEGANHVDADALLITGAIDSVGPQLGLMADGAVTNDTSPQLAGTLGTGLMPGQTLAVYRQMGNGTAVKVGVASVNGTAWTFQDGAGTGLTAPLADGNYTYQVVVESNGAPVSGLTPSGYFDLTVDTAAPAAPVTTVPEATGGDTFVNAAEKASDAGVPIVTQLAPSARVGDVVTTTVTLPDGSTRVLSTTLKLADIQAGSISQLLTQSALAADGAYSVSTTIASAINGLVSAPTVNTFTLDTAAPAAGTGALATASDSGTLGDNLTNDATPALSGTAEANATVQIVVHGQTYTVTANAQGGWSLPATATLPDGTYTPVITVTDAAGNSSTANGTPFTVDASLPAAGTGALATASDTGTLGDNKTNDATPALSGTAEANATVQIAINGQTYTVTANAQGAWSLPATATLPDGTYTPVITVTDAAGNSSTANGTAFTVDTTVAAGTGILASASDSGTLGDNLTNDATPELSGTAEANATVQIAINGQTYTVTANAQGAWALPATATLPDGTYTPVITVTDAAGNSSTANGTPFTVDASAPATPGVQIPDASHGVNVTEAADGVALVITLPNDAVAGDTLTTVVTAPGGGTLTLTRVLTATDITAGQVTQTVPQADLLTSGSTTVYRDGAWTTSTTLTDAAGNTSAAQTDGFALSANGPALTLNTVAGDGTVNALEKSGDLPVSGTTTAEVGQPVTVQLMSGSTVLGTYYTVVKADGTFALNIPQAQLPADGSYSLTANVSNFAGTPAAQQTQALLVDTTAPLISVTSVAADAVNATGSGTFDGTERGFNLSDYTLSNTVTTPPVISGTTTAEVGQTVKVLFNHVSYTATVQSGGTWSVTLSQDEAKALVHGTTYAITASVSDLAGNPSAPDADNHLVVNIAPPDVPTVVPQYAGTTTPVITGIAQKLSGGNAIALAAGDTLAITLNGVTVTATIQASGTATNITGVSYDPTTKIWSLTTATAGSFGLADDHTYDVQVSTTTAGGTLTRNDISAGELVIDTTPPAITLNPISPDAAGASVINGFEQNQPVSLTGTTTAQVGSTVTLTGLGGQTYTATVQAGSNGLNTYSIPVTGSDIAALTDGTFTPQVSVTNLFGLTGTDTETLTVDTTAPSAPTVALPEALGGINAAEALSNGGTPLVVTLPADAKVGDTVTTVVHNPDGTATVLTHVIAASELPAAQGGSATGAGPFTITQTIASSVLTVDGPWTTSTTVTDLAGNASAPQTGAFVLDTAAPGVPGVALPEALNGVNAAEAISNGGTPINVTLPGDAVVGDTVTTVVTLPTGGTLTLTTVLTAADIAAGAVSQLIPTSALTQDGTWSTSTTVTDLAGNASAPRTGSFVLDTTPPAAPAAVLAPASDTGTLGDSTTTDSTPSISGTGTPGDTLTVTFPPTATFPHGEVKTAVVAADGSWSVTPTAALADGVNTITVTATDPAGNVSAPTALPITVDTTAPLAPTAVLAAVSDTGTLGDNLTNDNTPTLSGTGVAGDTITVKDAAGNVIATAVVAANGTWAATPTNALPDGLNTLSITATDPAGNTGPAVALPITIDTGAPAAPAAVLAPASDSGTLLDGITNDNTPTLSGTGTAGDTITVTFPGGEVKTVVVASSGTWSVTPTHPLLDGLNTVNVTATDPAGNVSAPTAVPVTVDTTPPAAPLADVAAASDTGASNTDNITSDTTPTISGAGATPGDTIHLYDTNGTTVLGTAVVAPDGTWAITPTTALPEGLSTLSVKATDPAGNTSAATPVPVTIDTTAPVAPTVNAQDTNDSTPVITGTAILGAGETLSVTVNGATYNVTVGLGGLWSLNTSAVAPVSGTLGAFVSGQSYPVVATVTDAAGNATSDTTTSELRFDNTAPSVPTVNALATNDGTPVITGTANLLAGETLTVTVNGATYNVTVASNGTWRLDTGATTPASGTLGAFVNGTSYPVTATITDAATNSTSDTSTNELLFDTTAPSAPAGDVAAASDTGISATDNITSDTTPEIVGTGTAGDTITLYAPNGTTVLGTAVVDAAGHWSITSTALPQGTSALQITATDPAGNTSAPGTVSVTIDTTAPAAPTAVLDPASDSGVQGDNLTNDNTPTLSGTGVTGDTITVKDAAGNVIATAVVDANGNWSATPATALPNGLNALSMTATDPAGNTSQPTALPITIDTSAPSAPAAALAASSDTGLVGDAVTADTTPTLSGTGTPGDTITVKDGNGTVIATATVAPNGSWSATPGTALTDGLHTLQVTATDPAGNTGPATAVPVTIDATAPNTPTPDVAAASDTGTSSTDNLTSDTTPTLSGTGTPGDTMTLYAPNGTTVLGTAVVATNGTWAITPTTALPDGTTTLSVTATDLQGNTSAPGPVSVTIDTTAPAAPAAVLAPASDSGALLDSKTSDTTPTISGSGTPGDTITVTFPGGEVQTVVVAGNGTWSVTPTTALANGVNNLSVTATDPAGNTSLPTTLPITIDATVAAPVIAPTNGVGAITGTGEPGATVTLMDGATVIGTAVVDANGSWSLTPTSALPNATVLSATQTDLAGNASAPDTERVDTSVPVINPTNGVVLTGTGKPGDTIALTLADGTVLRDANGAPLTAVVDSNGIWTATPGAPVADGTTITATASYDADNNPATPAVVRSVTDSTTVDALPPSAPVATLALASDSGAVGDGITNVTTPTLSGAGASPGDTIKLYAPDGTTLLGTAVVAADGTWAIPVTNALTDGTYNFKLTATDPVGNTSAASTLPVTIDTSAPAAPAAALAVASDSGTVGDSTTSDTTPTISGTGTPGNTITVKDATGNVIATAVVDANGNWSATPTTALPEGLNTLQVTATDAAGNTSAATALPLTIDTTGPAAPAASLASVSDSGTLGDSTTSDTTPTLSGSGTPGDTITVKDAAGHVIATAVVASNGTWSATPTTALPEGLNTLSISATDAAGNTGPATALGVTIDTTGPAAPAASLASVSDSGKLGDSTTTDTTPTVSGTGMPGDTITIKNAAGTVVASATVAPDGTWSATPTSALPEGVNNLSVTATDAAGNAGSATALPLTIDTTAPAAPAAALALVSDTGTVGDSTTTDNTPTISGTGTPGDTMTVKDAAGNVIATAVVAANGSWSATTPTLPDGINALSVTATDPAGNVSAPTALPITVDTSIGAVSIDASNGVGAITGTGEPGATLTLKDSATGAVIGTVTVAPDGSWRVPLTASLLDGTVLNATQTDAAGNTSSPDTETINTAIPVLAPSNGAVITGTGKPGDTIAITVGGVPVLDGSNQPLTAVVDANGNWTATPGTPLANGSVVVATDTASGLTDTTTTDSQPPAVPAGTLATASDSAAVGDSLTSDNTPTITGSDATPGDTIQLYAPNGTTLLGSAVVDANGHWAITPTTALADGVQAFKISATDPLGNTSAQATVSVTIDTGTPAAPVAALSSGSDSGTLGDNTTNDTTPTVQGTGEPGATIAIKDAAGNVLAIALVDSSGHWSATTSTLPEGVNALSVTATDAAGNTSPPAALSLTIDTSAPATPAAPDLTAATDTGSSPTDNLTNVSTPAFAVTAPPAGGSLVLYVDGVAVAATYNASTGTLTPTVALTDGAHAITYKAVDAAGNASAASAALSVTIDTAAPAQPAAPDLTAATDSGSSATDNTTNVSTPAFAVTAPPAGGALVLYVDGVEVAATYNASIGTLTPTVPLTDGAHAITYKAVDAAGNASVASTALTVTIDTQAPDAPGGVLALASDSGTVGDNTTSDATPTIEGTGTAGDTITLKDEAGHVIATAVVDGSGHWSVTPSASLANGVQTLQITATDTAGNVSPASTLVLTIVNAPTVFTSGAGSTTLAITEDNTAQTVSGTLLFNDPDGPTTITALTNAAGTGGYGTFTTNATTGAWSYTMNSAQNQLTAGQVVTDTVTVSSADGTAQVLTVTITGTNDQPLTVVNDYFTTLEDAPAPTNGVTQGVLVSSLYMAGSSQDAEGTIAGVALVAPKTLVGSATAGTAWYSVDGGAH